MMYLYNGIELPALPNYDTQIYPYAVIVQVTSTFYRFIPRTSIPVRNTVNTYTGLTFKVAEGGTSWVSQTISVNPVLGIPVWTNHDMYYADDYEDESLAGTLYLEASDPIPVTPQPTPPRRRYNPMSRKGGYKIINLGDADLSTDPVIEGIYDAIEGNYRKRLVLSGLTVDAIEYPDLEIEVSLSGQDFTFAAYGNTITITPEDIVSLN